MNGNFRENFLKFFTIFYKNAILKDLGGEFMAFGQILRIVKIYHFERIFA